MTKSSRQLEGEIQAAISRSSHGQGGSVRSGTTGIYHVTWFADGSAVVRSIVNQSTVGRFDPATGWDETDRLPDPVRRYAMSLRPAVGSSPQAARRDAYPNDLLPGDLVARRDVKGRRKYRVSHTGSSAGFVQVYTRQVGDGRGQIVTFDRSQLRMV